MLVALSKDLFAEVKRNRVQDPLLEQSQVQWSLGLEVFVLPGIDVFLDQNYGLESGLERSLLVHVDFEEEFHELRMSRGDLEEVFHFLYHLRVRELIQRTQKVTFSNIHYIPRRD